MKASLSTLLAVLALTPLALATPSRAQEDAEEVTFYRVEAIVFTHMGGKSDAWPVEQPASHDGPIDPAWRAFGARQERERIEEGEPAAESDLVTALNMIDTIASLESNGEALTEDPLYPEPWLALDELSEPMAKAGARLEQSGAYRVRTWLAWHQPLNEDTASRKVRIHDQYLLAIDWISMTPTGKLLRGQRPVETVADLAPALHYRLDGTIRLRQRQFMHADITIDWRVPEMGSASPWQIVPDNAKIQTHRLEQSRTIRPDRFEYFDSQWLGLLLRITPYETEPVTPEPEEISEDGGTP